MKRFEGKVVYVTGGASGLGEAAVRRFAAEGARIAIADIDEDGAKRVAGSLPDAVAVRVDTSDPESVERSIAAAVKRYGRIDVIFNNAGISGEQLLIHEMSVENWKRVSRINGDGVFYVLKFGIAAMLRTGGGAIVNTSSTNGLVGIPNIAPYTFTKWGVIGLTKSTSIEYAKQGVRVNAVAPTVVRTPLVEKFIADAADPKEMAERMEAWNPMPGMPEANDVADAVLFLASDEARFITGHVIPIDGGYTAQ
jgi:NAD(P)-dependent dehydrogenase (short-subunit alcohol dehydrogenase family)